MSSDNPNSAGEIQTAAELPMKIVDRKAGDGGGTPSFFSKRTIGRALGLIGIVAVSVAVGGINGLYRQPQPLQYVMTKLGLEPGKGSADPIAVPVRKPMVPQTNGKGETLQSENGPRIIAGLGKLLPKGDVRTIGVPSEVRDARLASLNVDEGDTVAAGQVLATLDNEARLKTAVESARATVRLKQAELEQTKSATQASQDEARANLKSAEAKTRNAKLDLERTRTLLKKKITAQSTYDLKLATYEQAAREVDRARATLARYTSKSIEEQSDVLVAAANVASAKAELDRAMAELNNAYVRAPIAGTVLDVHVRSGEKVGSDGVVDIGNTDMMVAEVEIYESDIAPVRMGDKVTLSADALARDLNGTVSRIGFQVKRQSVIDSDPAANTDARVVQVIVDLDMASSTLAARLTNLQVTAQIAVGRMLVGARQ